MYGYLVKFYSKSNPLKTLNKTNSVELLPPWDSKYLQFIGFVKDNRPIPIHQLENIKNFDILKGSYPAFIQLNGNPKILKYRIKSVERIII